MRSSHLRRLSIAVAAVVSVGAIAATAQAAGPNGPGRHVLQGTRPSWTSQVQKTANVPSGAQVHAKVWLAPRNAAQLDALAQAVSDPSSSQFGQFISDDQFQAQFAPTAAQVAQVSQWLTEAGLERRRRRPGQRVRGRLGQRGMLPTRRSAPSSASFVVNGQQTQAPTSRPVGSGRALRHRCWR